MNTFCLPHRLRFALVNLYLSAILISFLLPACKQKKSAEGSGWEVCRGDDGSNAYSRLDQINTENVSRLRVAWTYRTGDPSDYFSLECNPLVVDTVLYGISPRLKTFALNAKSGKLLWSFDPFPKDSREGGVSRGLTYWKSDKEQRIFMFVSNKLIALDAETGKQIMSFGEQGYADLNRDLQNPGEPFRQEDVGNTSPAVIYKDLIITGSSVGEDYGSSPGHIRAYDVSTGKLRWIFHTIPRPGETGYDTWPKDKYKTAGGCNAWAGLSLDRKRGILFASTGTPSFDFHGGDRPGQNLFGNSVIAIDASTGKYKWHFQISHHDLWDYDLPSPPNLVTVKKGNREIDAVAQITKQGFIFVFDRETGKPLFPVEERPVAVSSMPGEHSWPTQPFPTKPLPLCRQEFNEQIITDLSPEAHAYVLKEAKKYVWGNIYLPPALKGIIQMPGYRGGAEWSGACVDRQTGILYVGINDIPNITGLLEKTGPNPDELSGISIPEAGAALFSQNCASCHGADRKGNGAFPPLINIEQRRRPSDVKNTIEKGGGMMPGFRSLAEQEKEAIVAFLFGSDSGKAYKFNQDRSFAAKGKQYGLKGYTQLLDQNGYPGVKPPWGTLNAVDLNSGELLWKVPLGQYPALAEKGHAHTGTQLFGGGIVTAGGLVFIGASRDEKFRAIDKKTGTVLWEYQLPAGGYATPATYMVDGKQYLVIAAGGGGRQRTKTGDYYIAFALP